jgi:hypothetical protein
MLLTECYVPEMGWFSCWDWILLFGTLPKICFAEGMSSYDPELGLGYMRIRAVLLQHALGSAF